MNQDNTNLLQEILISVDLLVPFLPTMNYSARMMHIGPFFTSIHTSSTSDCIRSSVVAQPNQFGLAFFLGLRIRFFQNGRMRDRIRNIRPDPTPLNIENKMTSLIFFFYNDAHLKMLREINPELLKVIQIQFHAKVKSGSG